MLQIYWHQHVVEREPLPQGTALAGFLSPTVVCCRFEVHNKNNKEQIIRKRSKITSESGANSISAPNEFSRARKFQGKWNWPSSHIRMCVRFQGETDMPPAWTPNLISQNTRSNHELA